MVLEIATNMFLKWYNAKVLNFKIPFKGDIMMHIQASVIDIQNVKLYALEGKSILRESKIMVGWVHLSKD